MKDFVTIRLEPETRRALTAEAKRIGVTLPTLLRTIAEECALDPRRRQIREQGKQLSERVKRSRARREFFEDWGTPAVTMRRRK